MIVEFVGLPASGKTTLSHSLKASLQDQGFCVGTRSELSTSRWSKLHRLAYYGAVSAKWPCGVGVAAWHLLTHSQVDRRTAFTSFINTLVERHILSRRLTLADVWVLDEGIFHRTATTVFGYSEETVDETNARWCVDHLPLPDLLFHLRIPVTVAIERMEQRGRPARMEGLTDGDVRAVMVSTSRCIEVMVHELERTPSGPEVIELPGHDISSARQALERVTHCRVCPSLRQPWS